MGTATGDDGFVPRVEAPPVRAPRSKVQWAERLAFVRAAAGEWCVIWERTPGQPGGSSYTVFRATLARKHPDYEFQARCVTERGVGKCFRVYARLRVPDAVLVPEPPPARGRRGKKATHEG